MQGLSLSHHLLCRNSGPSSPGGRSAPVSEVDDGEEALIPLGDEDDAEATGPPTAGEVDDAIVVVGLEVEATGCG